VAAAADRSQEGHPARLQVHVWETGQTVPTIPTLQRLAIVLGCSVADLVAGV
jgi:hypothetical protein